MNKKEINNKGFSLVELIIVIAIMAILVGVLAPQFIKYVERSRQAADMQTVQELRTAIEVYASGEGLTNDLTIVINGTSVSVTGTNAATVLSDSGLGTSATLKSSWPSASYEFSSSGLKWTGASGAALPDCINTKAPANNMKSVFSPGGGSSTT